jgi:hypothetical protein
MANLFKSVTRAAVPNSAGTAETVFTQASGTRCVILGLTLSNIHTSQVTASVILSSDTTQSNQVANTDAFIIKDAAIPVGSSLSVLDGKMIVNATDIIKVDCSVADKVSVIMSYMEIDS